jgi:hypothetical protein
MMRPSLFATAMVALLWSPPLLEAQRPLLQTRKGVGTDRTSVRRVQDGAGAVGQQATQVDVATLTDATQPASRPARVLARRQAEPTCKLACARERVNVSDGTDKGRRGSATRSPECYAVGR